MCRSACGPLASLPSSLIVYTRYGLWRIPSQKYYPLYNNPNYKSSGIVTPFFIKSLITKSAIFFNAFLLIPYPP